MPLCRQGKLGAGAPARSWEYVEEQRIGIEMHLRCRSRTTLAPFLGGQGPAGAHADRLTDTARGALEGRLAHGCLAIDTTARLRCGLARGQSGAWSPG